VPSGACVVRYQGKRGVVWYVKFRDASGRQVKERLGREADGWNETRAQRELGKRLGRVEQGGWRRPAPLTFAEYVETWFAEGESRRRWKPSTVAQYRSIRGRLEETFGPLPLAGIGPRHVAAYVAAMSERYGAATVSRDVSLLHAIFTSARREELVEGNPAERAERPRLPRRKWRILEPAEVGRVARAFTDEQARTVFLTLVLTGLRRSELQALRWGDVDLLEGVLRVRDSKTEEGIRSVAVPPRLQAVLAEHYQRTAFRGAQERVFCHPERGTVYQAETFAAKLRTALSAAGVDGYVRPFHDLRHSSLTLGAAAGEGPVALMTRAGHTDMATTRRYLHLAGTVFREEAETLERRLLGTELGTDLSSPERTSAHPAALPMRERTG
jgi:integrase